MTVRRALTQARRGGPVDTTGAEPLAGRLAEALDVSASRDAAPDLTHGFHTFPARMHPLTARRALALLGDLRGRAVLDPFCGSGTVLVEAHLAGARALGIDLSPLAVLVARAKCAVDEPLDETVARAHAIAERVLAEGRAARRAGGGRGRRLPDEVWRAFPPHVAAELAALRDAAEAEAEALRAPLLAILSSILVKVSRRESDTSGEVAPRLVARGAAARLFAARAEERARGLRDLVRRAPPGTPVPEARLGDARRLDVVNAGAIDAVLTSPPYPGTYDYAEQHALRLAFLGMDVRALEVGEIGARRRFAAERADAALEDWTRDMTAVLRGLARALAPGGAIALVIGDSRVGQGADARAVFADDALARIAPAAGLRVAASASQRRTALGEAERRAFARRPKREHLLYLDRG